MSDFEFSDMQLMMRDTLGRFFADRYGFAVRQSLLASEKPYSPEIWDSLATELGVLGASFAEDVGGLGGSAVERMVVMEEIGRAMVLEPYLSTVVLGGGILSRVPGDKARSLLGQVVEGQAIIAFAQAEAGATLETVSVATRAAPDGDGYRLDGAKTLVFDAPVATHLIVAARTSGQPSDPDGISLFLVEAGAPGVALTGYRTIGGATAAEVHFDNVRVGAEALLGAAGAAGPLIAQVMDEAVVAICAEAVGILEQLVSDTVDYTKQRRQFGKAIAEFQVLQHAMVDMHIAAEGAKAITLTATLALDGPAEDRAALVSAAKTRVAQACRSVAQAAVQLHGGMGMTDELAIGHLFRRALMIESQFGSADEHRKRFERLSFDAI